MKKPEITIILPALNSIDYIRQCLDSILQQTLQDFELLCVDAGSTDGTVEVFEEYARKDPRIRVLHSEQKSYGHQVNLGMDAAQGVYMGIVESDDFIDPHMYEDLYRISRNGTVDIVRGNFYFYYDYIPDNPFLEIEEVRLTLPEKTPSFTVNEQPLILKGHPAIWSAIYRLEFLRSHNIRLPEIPGGGWSDNPFFFETVCSAASICFTQKPYYYYRCSNPNSSSNKIPDLTMPIRRMLDNLDITERFDLNDQCLKQIYERGLIYLNGSVWNLSYASQETEVRTWAMKMLKRMDKRVVDDCLEGWYRSMYYSFCSPVMLKRPRAGRILLYDYMPEDRWNRCITFSEEKATWLRSLLDTRMDIEIYVLTQRRTNSQRLPFSSLEKLFNRISRQIIPIDVINQELLSVELFQKVLSLSGPFDLVYFITEKGLDDQMKALLHSENDGAPYLQSFEELLEAVRSLPVQGDTTFSAEEYQAILRENDYLHRVLEKIDYGKHLEDPGYQHLEKKREEKIRKERQKAQLKSGWQCVKDHGLLYTFRLYRQRKSE